MIRQTSSQYATNRYLTSVVLYQNEWCQIIYNGAVYILRSKAGKYNDQYYKTFHAAKKAIGMIP